MENFKTTLHWDTHPPISKNESSRTPPNASDATLRPLSATSQPYKKYLEAEFYKGLTMLYWIGCGILGLAIIIAVFGWFFDSVHNSWEQSVFVDQRPTVLRQR